MYNYCRLILNSAQPLQNDKAKGLLNRNKIIGWGYDCCVHYFKSTGEVEVEQVSEIHTPLNYDPFAKKFAELASQGWELVQTHHTMMNSESGTVFDMSCQMAYFKKGS